MFDEFLSIESLLDAKDFLILGAVLPVVVWHSIRTPWNKTISIFNQFRLTSKSYSGRLYVNFKIGFFVFLLKYFVVGAVLFFENRNIRTGFNDINVIIAPTRFRAG